MACAFITSVPGMTAKVMASRFGILPSTTAVGQLQTERVLIGTARIPASRCQALIHAHSITHLASARPMTCLELVERSFGAAGAFIISIPHNPRRVLTNRYLLRLP